MLPMSPVNKTSSSSSPSQPIHSPTHLTGMFIRDDDDYGDLNVDQIREKGLGTTPTTASTPTSAPTTGTGASGSIVKDMDTTTTTFVSAALPLVDSDGSPRHGTIANPRSNSNSPEASLSHNSPSPGHSASSGQNASPGANSSPSASPGHSASPGANGSPNTSPNTSPGPVASSKRSKSRHHGKGKGTDTTVLASLANDG